VASPPSPSRPPRRALPTPRYTLTLLYFFALVVLFGILFALPDLLAAYRALPPGQGPLTPEELARAREVARGALRGRLPWVIAAALATVAAAARWGWLPGLRRRGAGDGPP
jgi:Na+/proline symporter